MEFLERVQQQIKDAKLYRSEAQPQLYLQAHVAEYKLDLGDLVACKALQEQCRQTLDTMQEVQARVWHAQALSTGTMLPVSLAPQLCSGPKRAPARASHRAGRARVAGAAPATGVLMHLPWLWQTDGMRTAGRPVQVDPDVSAAVCLASSQYYKYVKDFAQFYKTSLLYLAFVSTKDLDPARRQVRCRPLLWRTPGAVSCTAAAAAARHQIRELREYSECRLSSVVCGAAHRSCPCPYFPTAKPPDSNVCAQALAVDISLAALLGKDVYSFGELLLHPIVRLEPLPPWCSAAALCPAQGLLSGIQFNAVLRQESSWQGCCLAASRWAVSTCSRQHACMACRTCFPPAGGLP